MQKLRQLKRGIQKGFNLLQEWPKLSKDLPRWKGTSPTEKEKAGKLTVKYLITFGTHLVAQDVVTGCQLPGTP